MKKNPILKWLAISFLLGISIFCYTMYAKISTNTTLPNTTANAGESNNNQPNINPKPDPTPEKPKVLYNSYPREAIVSNGVLVQNIGGMEQEKLQAVHNLGKNTYIIFNTASNSYDIKSNQKTVAIALIDEQLTLQNVFVIPTNSDETFGASKITSGGILLITHSNSYTKLYKISYNLAIIDQIQFEKSNSSYMYFTEGGTYLFMSQSDKLCSKLITPNFQIASTSSMVLENSKIIDVFPFAEGFNIYVSGEDYYGYATFNYSSGLKNSNLIYGHTIKQIFPTTEKGQLVFGALLYAENNYKMIKMNREMSTVATYDLGCADVCFMYPLGENFWVYKLNESVATTMLFCTHLDKVFECPTDYKLTFSSIHNYSYPALQFFAYNNNHELLILSTTGGEPKLIDSYQAVQGYTHIDSNGTIYLTSASKQNYFCKNFGNYDIFIIKKPTKNTD